MLLEINNSLLNGSSIYISSGSDSFKALNCIFRGNNASNGTVYASNDTNRPVFNNCTFTDNHAEYLGGAIYIVSDLNNKVPVGLDSKTNETILYPGDSGYEIGFNDFYGYLTDTFMELYLINDTTGYTITDGKSRETPSNNLMFIMNLMDYGHVYFIREGDTFEGKGYSYKPESNNLVFHGNKTTIMNMGFIIPENYKVDVYNMTLDTYTKDSALIVNGTDCVFENCSFKNTGGNSVSYGGAILINGNNIVLKNITFIKNYS